MAKLILFEPLKVSARMYCSVFVFKFYLNVTLRVQFSVAFERMKKREHPRSVWFSFFLHAYFEKLCHSLNINVDYCHSRYESFRPWLSSESRVSRRRDVANATSHLHIYVSVFSFSDDIFSQFQMELMSQVKSVCHWPRLCWSPGLLCIFACTKELSHLAK